MTTSTQAKPDDAIDLLLRQHDRVRTLLSEVEASTGDQRRAAFDELRRFLAVHETAEELVIHPSTRRQGPEGENIADARLQEENEGKDVLSSLEDLDVDDAEFETMFAEFTKAVSTHAENEETEEFPLLRARVSAEDLASMAKGLRAAEKLAPTHPHPGAESVTANTVLGPIASLVDRTRDAVRDAMGR